MKVYEILSLNPQFLKMLHSFGIKNDDYKYLGMYREYLRMKKKNEKTSYIVAHLSEKYNVCERKVYKVIKLMEKDCQIGAVR
jgi:hypothetical protein